MNDAAPAPDLSTGQEMLEFLQSASPQQLVDLPQEQFARVREFFRSVEPRGLVTIRSANPAAFEALSGITPLPPPTSKTREDVLKMSPLELARFQKSDPAEFNRLTRNPFFPG